MQNNAKCLPQTINLATILKKDIIKKIKYSPLSANPERVLLRKVMSINYNYNVYCNSGARNCTSGCCNQYGNCATSSFTCQYPYDDYYSSYNGYYYGTPTYKYNINCNSNARNCVSGCCTTYGSCANTSSSCYYKYSDYYSNSSYYFPGNTNTNNYTTPYNYNYNNYYSTKTSQVLAQTIAVPIGVTLAYLLPYIIGIIICFCRRKPMVQAINNLATHNSNGQPVFKNPALPPPTFGIDPTYLQSIYNPTYPGQQQTNFNHSPNKNAVLTLDTSLNNSFNQIFNNGAPAVDISPQRTQTPVRFEQ